MPHHLVDRVVAADVLAQREQPTVRIEEPRRVEPSGLGEQCLGFPQRVAEPRERLVADGQAVVPGAGDALDVDRFDRGLPADAAARRRVEVASEPLRVVRRARPQDHVHDVVPLAAVEGGVGTVADRPDILRRSHHAFGAQEPGRQFEVVSGRAHRDRDPLVRCAVGRIHPDFERFFDGEDVGAGPGRVFAGLQHLPADRARPGRGGGLGSVGGRHRTLIVATAPPSVHARAAGCRLPARP